MEYRNPKPTVDVVIVTPRGVVLVRRANPPHGWALPGGFIDEGEPAEVAAIREVREETGLHIALDDLLGVYSDPARDPRFHTMAVVYTARSDGTPVGGDDALEARCFSLDALPAPIAFDHKRILQDYRTFQSTGSRPDPMRDVKT
jgi:8-oxo-dGTP diphosphatase